MDSAAGWLPTVYATVYVRNYDAAGFAVSVNVCYEVNYDRVE